MSHALPTRALITGASRGIGAATAIAFAKAGVNLALVSRSADSLESVAAAARKLGVAADTYPIDLEALDQVAEKIGAIATASPIDILVNNAGIGYTGDLLTTPLPDWQRVINLNLTSVFQCIQAVLPGMRDRGQGVIINIASIAGYHAFPGWGAYNVSKAGLIALSKTLAAEERSHGIRVVTFSPGSVNTPIWDTDTVQADFDRSRMLTADVVAQSIVHTALLPPGAVIEEITLVPSAGAL
ncbi:SDR family oxidoreductase [Thermoleptolyngbya sichuanensis A183]|uniref:SDR family oxidoreductase n=1 Tax=Thermoleptolyngbya sichuanensis A183 TaxID=2737172 RepID=A0A6M8BGS3_9CYAN|nr:SDR family oxidoreductase [Thermoleptolyngbya sichuanensis]MDG2617893.1 SDR family oxidoreductase [Thermoleptolyngbya sichuanensis XZ-Cy5]QKD82821.1 SDR family oxidoreductase [Thermoleptolyngbya sichuanensis A183]